MHTDLGGPHDLETGVARLPHIHMSSIYDDVRI